MPTYTFKCNKCEITIDEIRSMDDDSKLLCGKCGNEMSKIINNCNYILKGGGWTGKDQSEKKERLKNSEDMGKATKEKLNYNHDVTE